MLSVRCHLYQIAGHKFLPLRDVLASATEIARAAIALADSDGLSALTMRAVAAAIGAAPASLYRYVNTRSEVLELMADQAAGEYALDEPSTGEPVTDLLALAHQVLAVYRRHPWLLEIPPAPGLPGPNAPAYMEHILATLSGTALSRYRKLEPIGLLGGTIRSFAQMEADQQRACSGTGPRAERGAQPDAPAGSHRLFRLCEHCTQ
jgi:AcrR family transcriptional regulator